MCRAVHCKTCGKTTWAGCGRHIANVKATVPAGRWCAGGHSTGEKTAAARSSGDGSFFGKLFGRS
jgi:hypothetical protein